MSFYVCSIPRSRDHACVKIFVGNYEVSISCEETSHDRLNKTEVKIFLVGVEGMAGDVSDKFGGPFYAVEGHELLRILNMVNLTP